MLGVGSESQHTRSASLFGGFTWARAHGPACPPSLLSSKPTPFRIADHGNGLEFVTPFGVFKLQHDITCTAAPLQTENHGRDTAPCGFLQ